MKYGTTSTQIKDEQNFVSILIFGTFTVFILVYKSCIYLCLVSFYLF